VPGFGVCPGKSADHKSKVKMPHAGGEKRGTRRSQLKIDLFDRYLILTTSYFVLRRFAILDFLRGFSNRE
jgi:hypothetical protein